MFEFRELVNRCLAKNLCTDLSQVGENLRDWFSKTDFSHVAPYKNHTHGSSAAVRTIGANFIELVSELSGAEAFYFQGSAADERKGRSISRDWFWAKDLNMTLVAMPPPPSLPSNRVVAMVDVDEYCDMSERLALDFRPYLLYTFVPSRAAKSEGEYTYRFLQDGKVEYVVAGGGQYTHEVWNYGSDSIQVTGTEWLWITSGLPVPVRVRYTAFYKVERRNVDADHQVVLLSPMKRWSEFMPAGFATIASYMISAPPLKRLDPISGDFVRIETVTREGIFVSTARVGDFSSSYVPKRVDEEVSIKSFLCKEKLTPAMVKSTMAASELKLNGAEVMTAFHRVNSGSNARNFSTTGEVRAYQILPKLADYDPDAPPSMNSFMAPLLHGGFAPDQCRANDRVSVMKRVLQVRSETEVTPFLMKAIKVFVSKLAGVVLVPVDEDEVSIRQNRPSQRAILERANYQTSSGIGLNFMKRQAEMNVGHPRMITTIDGRDKLEYSRYIYALSDFLKTLPWYISGLKPREVAQRVADVCTLATEMQWVAETDFSRMDGRISQVARYLERQVMFTLFPKQFHAEIAELMKRQTFLRCSTKFGEFYDSQLARGSGSPETSAFNTILTGFVMFLGYHMSGSTFHQAWDRLMVGAGCCGDDGIAAGLPAESAVAAAKIVGQKLTIQIRTPGQTVSFLSRYYGPDVWFGDLDSCCDLKRQLSKFHLATYVERDALRRQLKLREKSFAFYLTDECTPALGLFVTRVLALAPVQHGKGTGREYQNILRLWNSDIPKIDQYPSLPDVTGWKQELLSLQIPDFDLGRFNSWVMGCNSLEELMNAPEPIVIEAVHPGGDETVVVDSDVLSNNSNTTKSSRGRRGGKRVRRMKQGEKQPIAPSAERKPRVATRKQTAGQT